MIIAGTTAPRHLVSVQASNCRDRRWSHLRCHYSIRPGTQGTYGSLGSPVGMSGVGRKQVVFLPNFRDTLRSQRSPNRTRIVIYLCPLESIFPEASPRGHEKVHAVLARSIGRDFKPCDDGPPAPICAICVP